MQVHQRQTNFPNSMKKPSQNLIPNAFIFKSLIITGSLHKWYSEGNLTRK